MGDDHVVGPGQPGDRVEKDDDIATVFDEPLGFFDHHIGHLDVPVGRFIEGRGDDLGFDVFLHVGDFFGALVDQEDDQDHLGVVLVDRVGELLHQDGLTSLRLGDDQAALALADGRQEVDHPHRDVALFAFEPDPRVRIARLQVVEGDPVLGLFGLFVVDLLDLEQGEVPFAFLRRPDLPHNRIAGSEVESLDLARADVDIVRAVEVVPVLASEETVALGEDFEDPFAPDDGVLVEQGLLDAEDEILLAKARVVGDVQLLGKLMQFCDGLLLQFGNVHGGNLVAGDC